MDTNVYKTKLEELRATLIEELSTIGIHDPENTSNWEATLKVNQTSADPNVMADNAEELEERVATLALLETRFNNINRALTKIEKGEFGICEINGEEIEADRLDANPAARTCKEHLEEESSLSL